MADLTRDEIIRHGVQIAAEYNGNLTVRQLYYQFVARGLLPSGQSVYQRVVSATAKARLTGEMPFDWIVDRTRTAKQSDCLDNYDDVDTALDESIRQIRKLPNWLLRRSRWHGQPKHVTVGVEKEALAGVFEDTCDRLGVGLFVFRGYASLSSLYQWAENLQQSDADEAILLYFGDHDPDGWEIPRSALRNVEEIAEAEDLWIPNVTLTRVALNMEQIERYDPPPFEAKVSSSRYAKYYEEHGTDEAWELDALRPDVLQSLIRGSVNEHFDEEIHMENLAEIRDARDTMLTAMKADGWLDQVFA